MYEKENKKGGASSLRFNETQISIALSRSGKKSKQQLFDWLLDKYVNDENPIIERRQQVYDSPKVHTGFSDEPRQIQQPKLNQYQAYYAEIKQATSLNAFPAIVAAIKSDNDLGAQEKVTLEKLAIQESKNDRFF